MRTDEDGVGVRGVEGEAIRMTVWQELSSSISFNPLNNLSKWVVLILQFYRRIRDSQWKITYLKKGSGIQVMVPAMSGRQSLLPCLGERERRGGWGKEEEHIWRSPRMGKGIDTHHHNRVRLIRKASWRSQVIIF